MTMIYDCYGNQYYCTPKKDTYLNISNDYNSKATAESSDNDSGFEFDVRPKRKYFETPQEKMRYIQEYTKKKKTEMCKNFTLKGYCRFGDGCSFAHGREELIPKQHLHQNFKTKPCKRYFKTGFCCYGNRCQYIHEDQTKKEKETQKKLQPQTERTDILRFQKLASKFNIQLDKEVNLVTSSRLNIFKAITEEADFLSDVSDLSRKSSF